MIAIAKLDPAATVFMAAIEWPEGVPAPEVDVVIKDAAVLLRFVAHAGAPIEAPADYSSPGESPIDMITALALLAEAWCLRHNRHGGSWPDGVRAQIATRLDMRTAAAWLYSAQLAGTLAVAVPPR